MPAFFAFKGKIGQIAYGLWSAIFFFLPHAVAWGVFQGAHKPLELGWRFWTTPLLSLARLEQAPPPPLLLGGFVFMLVATWALTALAFQRAASANWDGWLATLVAAPVIQIPAMLFLLVLPARAAPDPLPASPAAPAIDWVPAAQGVLAGVGLTLFAVAVGALVFGSYGYGIFVLSPFVIGAATAFLANRKQDIGPARTLGLMTLALAVGGAALVVVALEGMVCIVLVAPLAWAAAVIGSFLGRAAASAPRRRARSTLMSVALLPLAFAAERALPNTTTFATDERIEIAAPADAVWQALIRMDSIDIPPSLPFQLGVAYPVRGEIAGSGVGAIRTGVFSTGIAIERVTAWQPGRELAFTVLTDPPAMHEMSPYRHVNAPHVTGYFRTASTAFEIVRLANGHSLLKEHTVHQLRLDPILYWMPLARWIIHQNNTRVLASVRQHAEHLAAR